jgi:hypothetical protein
MLVQSDMSYRMAEGCKPILPPHEDGMAGAMGGLGGGFMIVFAGGGRWAQSYPLLP